MDAFQSFCLAPDVGLNYLNLMGRKLENIRAKLTPIRIVSVFFSGHDAGMDSSFSE